MPSLLEAPKAVSKQEEFVEKQIDQARRRIRLLDWFVTGLALLIGTLAFAFTILLVDRYVETPTGTGWAVVGIYLASAAGFLYWSLFRASRRQINPYFAARQVEQTIPDAKNSVVNYVDLKDDSKIPGSVMTAIGVRAAKDLKHVDLNQAIHKRQILWLAGVAAFLFVATVVAALLPPTRTTLTLLSPKGDTTIIQGEDLTFEVEIRGRIPQKSEPDAPRLRLWYNPDDPSNYEDRALEPIDGKRNQLGLTIPAKQIRNGFSFKVLAGNAVTPSYEVKVHIIPQFTGWTVEYDYPAYLQREPGKTNDPNLVGNYGTNVTLTAFTNRPVKAGFVEIEGQLEPVAGQLLEENPEAIRFRFSMLRNGTYRVRFVTTEGHRNPDPPRYRMALVDPKPIFLRYDVTYDYPKYLRASPVTVNVRQPDLEALRGTSITLIAHANRPIKDAKVHFPGREQPIAGEVDPKKPMQAKFTLPPLMEDGAYRVAFSPKTDEGPSSPETFTIRVLSDEKPKVTITKPQQPVVELPANGVLVVEGLATDDIGLAKINLRMEVISPAPVIPLAPKVYRDGISFRRESDNSYPTEIEYKDLVDLAKVKPEGQAAAGFQLQAGMVVEYWLEAIDNCDVPPGPNSGMSQKQRVQITAPLTPAQQKQKQQEKEDLQRQQKQHEQKQDQQNANEKRQPKQPQPKGDPGQKQKGSGGAPEERQPRQGDPKTQDGMGGDMQPMQENPQPQDDPNLQNQADQVANALDKQEPKNGSTGSPNKTQPAPAKTDPNKKDADVAKKDNVAKSDNPDEQPPKKDNHSKKDNPDEQSPKKDVGKKDNPDTQPPKKDGTNSETNPDPNQLPKPENFKELAEKLHSNDPDEREQAREQLKQMMDQAKKNPPKPEDQQKKIDEHRNKLDPEEKKEFDQAMQDLQKEMQNLNRDERARTAEEKSKSADEQTREQGKKELEDVKREQRVQKAAEKAMSNDEKTRQEGQKELEKELQNQNAGNDVDRQLQNLANDTRDPNKKQKLDDARNLARENLKKQPAKGDAQPPMPKKEENDVDRLAKKIKKGSPEEKKQAEDELQKKLQDKNQRERVEKQLDDIKNNITDEQERKNFEKSMENVQRNVAKKDADGQQPKLKPEDVKQFADKLTSDNKQEREQAEEQLKEAMKQAAKDPKANEQARKELDDIRNSIKDEQKQKQFDESLSKIDNAVQKEIRDQEAKAQQQREADAKSLAQDLNSKDPDKQKAAQDKLQEMLKDPKNRDAAKSELDKIKKNADPATKDNIDKAMRQAERNIANEQKKSDGTGQPGKDEMEKLAQDLNSKDPDKQKAAQDKLQEMLKDPKNRDAAKSELDKIKKNADPATKENIEKAMQDAEKSIAKEKKNGDGMGEPNKDELQKLTQDLNSKDEAKQQAAQQKLEEMLKDPKNADAVKSELENIKKNADPATQKNIDKATQQAAKNNAKEKKNGGGAGQPNKDDLEKLAQDLNSGDPDKQKAAQEKLQEMLKDPKTREAVKNDLNKTTADPRSKENLDNAVKQAEENIAKLDGKKGGGDPKIDPKDVDKLLKQLQSKQPEDQKAAQKKLEEMMNDPAKRAAFEKQLDEMKKDPEKLKQIQKATEDFAKQQVEQLADKVQNGTPQQKQLAKQQLDDLMKSPARDMVKKQLDDYRKNLPDDQARQDFDKKLKEMEKGLAKKDLDSKTGKHDPNSDGKKSGEVTNQDQEGPGSLPDLKNKLKSGELILEKFKKNITNEEFRKSLKWTPEQMAEFQRKYEQNLAAMRKKLEAAEKGELPPPRLVGPSVLDKAGPEKISLDPKNSGGANAGGKFVAPPGFADPYKRFTEEVSGSSRIAPPK